MNSETAIDGVSTRDRLLNVTSALVAEHGFEGVSLRSITREAEANVASINYHFGGKEKLFEEIQIRYVKPANEERSRLLDELLEGGGEVSLEAILSCFMRPLVVMMKRSEMNERLLLKMMARCSTNNNGVYPEILVPLVQRVLNKYTKALHSQLPELEIDQLLWRLHYSFGAMIHTLMHSETMREISNDETGKPDFEKHVKQLVTFCAAGFRADVS